MSDITTKLKQGQNLSFGDSKSLFSDLMEGKHTEDQIIEILDALIKKGAKNVYVFITHAVLSGDAINKIKKSKIKKLVITDSILSVITSFLIFDFFILLIASPLKTACVMKTYTFFAPFFINASRISIIWSSVCLPSIKSENRDLLSPNERFWPCFNLVVISDILISDKIFN